MQRGRDGGLTIEVLYGNDTCTETTSTCGSRLHGNNTSIRVTAMRQTSGLRARAKKRGWEGEEEEPEEDGKGEEEEEEEEEKGEEGQIREAAHLQIPD